MDDEMQPALHKVAESCPTRAASFTTRVNALGLAGPASAILLAEWSGLASLKHNDSKWLAEHADSLVEIAEYGGQRPATEWSGTRGILETRILTSAFPPAGDRDAPQ